MVLKNDSNSVMKINPVTGAVSSPITVGSNPSALAFDGSSIWVANEGNNSVSKLAAAGQPVGVLSVGATQLNDAAIDNSKISDGAVTDIKISGSISAAKLDLSSVVKKSGDTMTGTLNLPNLTVTGTIESTSGGVKFPDASMQTSAKTDCMGRYEDNSDGTVTDCRTGLVWLKNAGCTDSAGGIDKGSATLVWGDSVVWSAALATGTCGLTDGSSAGDWRMPTRTEWMAMVASARKQGFSTPALTNRAGTAKWAQGDLFNDIQPSYYWSSSTYMDYAGVVSMYDGSVNTFYKTDNRVYIWPVRAGQ